MKSIMAVLVAGGMVLSLTAQTSPPGKAADSKTISDPKPAPSGKAAKKDEPAPTIDGIEIARGTRGFLGVQIVSGAFRLNFYDAKKKPMEPDMARAVLKWDAKYKIGGERVVLNPGEPNMLSNPRPIRPPYTFKLFITLLKDASAEGAENPVGESYVIDFKQ